MEAEKNQHLVDQRKANMELQFVLSIISIILIISFINAEQVYNSQTDASVRIVGGEEAEPHSAPFIASLFLKVRGQYIAYCAGSLISVNWVLTAAHCLSMRARRIHIGVGLHIQTLFDEYSQIQRADYHIVYDDYTGGKGPHDIGLIHARRPFKFTEYVQPIPLDSNDLVDGDATIFGWGSVTQTRKRIYPNALQTGNLTIKDIDYCRKFYESEIDESNICAGNSLDEEGACVGDSGGPMTKDNFLIGIISWGPITCNITEGPSIFTKVSYFLPWIQETMKLEENLV